jgi:hypothetical protein
MTQALYAHMNNKTKQNISSKSGEVNIFSNKYWETLSVVECLEEMLKVIQRAGKLYWFETYLQEVEEYQMEYFKTKQVFIFLTHYYFLILNHT